MPELGIKESPYALAAKALTPREYPLRLFTRPDMTILRQGLTQMAQDPDTNVSALAREILDKHNAVMDKGTHVRMLVDVRLTPPVEKYLGPCIKRLDQLALDQAAKLREPTPSKKPPGRPPFKHLTAKLTRAPHLPGE